MRSACLFMCFGLWFGCTGENPNHLDPQDAQEETDDTYEIDDLSDWNPYPVGSEDHQDSPDHAPTPDESAPCHGQGKHKEKYKGHGKGQGKDCE